MRRLTRLIRPTTGAASGNWCTMPDAMLDASYQAYNGYRIGRPDKAFTPHPARIEHQLTELTLRPNHAAGILWRQQRD
ncbi:hypothetical protein BZG30_16275 [Escherichia coli]|nr:hypothetical protein [Escherichia coli]